MPNDDVPADPVKCPYCGGVARWKGQIGPVAWFKCGRTNSRCKPGFYAEEVNYDGRPDEEFGDTRRFRGPVPDSQLVVVPTPPLPVYF